MFILDVKENTYNYGNSKSYLFESARSVALHNSSIRKKIFHFIVLVYPFRNSSYDLSSSTYTIVWWIDNKFIDELNRY